MRRDVLVVLPTYNEAENIEPIAHAILAQGAELLVVDDNSPDGTGNLADRIASTEPRAHVLHRSHKDGLGPAYAAGLAWGLDRGSGVVCGMDADFSHSPADLPRLVAAVDDGADLAIGSRYVPGGGIADWSQLRRALSRGGNRYAKAMLGLEVRDLTGGFRAFRAAAIAGLRPDLAEASGYGFQVEMAWRAESSGLRVVEVPIVFRDRVRGESKMNARIALEAVALVTRWGVRRLTGRLRWPPD